MSKSNSISNYLLSVAEAENKQLEELEKILPGKVGDEKKRIIKRINDIKERAKKTMEG